jgi:hypothetical protein
MGRSVSEPVRAVTSADAGNVTLSVLWRTVATGTSSLLLAEPWAVRCGAVAQGGFGRPDGHPRS